MKRIAYFLAAATAIVLTALPAQAQFGGCYVGAHAGGALTASRGSVTGGMSDGGAIASGLVGTHVGCNGMVGNKTFIGAELSGDVYGLHQGSPVFSGTGGADLERSVSAIARAGYVFAPHTAAYVGAGYSWNWISKITAGSMSLKVPDSQAPLVLAGLEWRGFKNVSVDARYTATFERGDSFAVDPSTSAKIDRVDHAVRFGVNFFFSDPSAAPAKLPGKP